MAISENIEVDAGEAIASVDDLATAFEELADKASAAIGKIDSALDGLGGGSAAAAGPDKLVAAWDKAADSVSAAADKIAESIGKIGDIGAVSSAAGPDKLAASWDDAAASISASVDKIAGAGAKIDDLGAGAAGAAGPVGDLGKALDDTAAGADKLGASGAGAADGIKGIGTSADESAAQLAEFNAVMRESAAAQADAAAASADASAKIAAAQRVNTAAAKDASDDAIAAQAAQANASKQAAADAEASATKYHMLALGGAAALGYGVYKAAQLQTAVTRLYTTAGESQSNLGMISSGILALSGQTNTSQAQLGQGAYWVESAGFHGQSALNILKAVAEGSQSEGAPLQDVANATTSLMNAYGMKGSQQQAMQAVNQMLTVVGEGKMTMAQLATALPAVLPLAASHGPGEQPISFAQVGGALATMTGMGYSAQWGAQHLSHTIGALQNPNQVQTQYMQQFGLNPNEISKNLGSQGLTGTLSEIQTAVLSHMGKSGMVMLNAMNKASSYLNDANIMLPELPKSVQGFAQQFEQGKISQATFQQEMFKGGQSAIATSQLKEFAANVDKAHGFNPLLAAGQPAEMAYQAAISKIMGGSVGEQTFLSLMGEHLGTFKQNVDAAGESVKKTGDNVMGWKQVQDTLNFQLGSFEKTTEAVATEAGQTLLPAVTTVMKGLSSVGGFFASNPALTKDLTIGGGVIGAAALLPKLASAGTTAVNAVGTVGKILQIPGADKLASFGNVGKSAGLDTAATDLAGSATDLTGAATDLSGAAEKLSTVGGPGGMPGGTPGREESTGETATADAEDAGDAGGFLAGIKAIPGAFSAAAGTVAQGVALGMIIKGIGDQIAPAGSQAGKDNRLLQKTPATNDSSMMPYIFGGFEGKLMSSIGLGVGGAISKFIDGTQTSNVNAAQSRFSSRFGVPAPGTATVAPSAAPAAATQRPDLLGVGGHPGTVSLGTVDTSSLDAAKSKVQADIKAIDSVFAEAKAKGITIPAPDLSALDSAKSKLKSDMDGINQELSAATGKPSKIAAPDLSQVEAAKGKALSDATSIMTGLQSALNKQVRAAPPDLSPFVAAAGQARSDGANITLGLASGINAEAPAAEHAAQAVASQVAATMAHALQTRSPSKVTEVIGKDTSAGLAKGITEGTSTVKASAVSLSASTITSLTTGLQGGQSAIDAAMQALGTAKPQDITTITSTISTLKGDVAQALSAGQITKPEDSALVKMLTRDNAKLQALSTRRTMLETEITDAQQIAQQAISNASIMNAGTYTPALAASSGPLAASATISGMQAQEADQAQFAQQIGQLKKEGLNATSLNQIVQSGASAGLPVAEGLTQGGKSAIAQINKLQSQIHSSAAVLGSEAAGPMYQAGVQAAQGLASGIMSQLGAVDSAIKNMANSMVSTIKGALKSHSPSQVFHDEALSIPQGVASGVDAGTPIAQAAVSRMGNSLGGRLSPYHPGLAYGNPANGGSSGPGGGGHTTVNVTVMGSVISENDLVAAVSKGLLKQSSNNWQAGIKVPGRAG